MKPFACLLMLISASGALNLAALPEANPAQVPLGHVHRNTITPRSEEDSLSRGGKPQTKGDIDADSIHIDDVPSDDDGNFTSLPDLSVPKLANIGYGTQWKKGIQHWVAFPMLGPVACKKFVDLGTKGAGEKHGACQKSFRVLNTWYQLNGCNPTTGMPKSLLDGDGKTIKSCAKKEFKVMCLKEGIITGKGSCELPPPDEGDLSDSVYWEEDILEAF